MKNLSQFLIGKNPTHSFLGVNLSEHNGSYIRVCDNSILAFLSFLKGLHLYWTSTGNIIYYHNLAAYGAALKNWIKYLFKRKYFRRFILSPSISHLASPQALHLPALLALK